MVRLNVSYFAGIPSKIMKGFKGLQVLHCKFPAPPTSHQYVPSYFPCSIYQNCGTITFLLKLYFLFSRISKVTIMQKNESWLMYTGEDVSLVAVLLFSVSHLFLGGPPAL